ncbi:helix-turn-helix transcriptional regulator [uncultured Pseudodesulfovibrio sp.]|uniref:helix-turn-helix domain-containing protein n=1 Tax=uncultured Pseudodesulfovibrio sp. TaxID=2035858 RepID=UPI0029C8D181|nr:helix-turn-helix transcriptional regulator [uncultured Pseudodesulfovibrio sp.]
MSILFGDYIRGRRQLRRERSPEYSIRQVAKRIGIHHSYLSKVERGSQQHFPSGPCRLSLENLRKIQTC